MTPSNWRARRHHRHVNGWPLAGLGLLVVSGVISVAIIAVLVDVFFGWWVG